MSVPVSAFGTTSRVGRYEHKIDKLGPRGTFSLSSSTPNLRPHLLPSRKLRLIGQSKIKGGASGPPRRYINYLSPSSECSVLNSKTNPNDKVRAKCLFKEKFLVPPNKFLGGLSTKLLGGSVSAASLDSHNSVLILITFTPHSSSIRSTPPPPILSFDQKGRDRGKTVFSSFRNNSPPRANSQPRLIHMSMVGSKYYEDFLFF